VYIYDLCTQIGDDTNPNSVIEEIMESPEKLRDLDLDAFAEELERQVHLMIKYYLILYIICRALVKSELLFMT